MNASRAHRASLVGLLAGMLLLGACATSDAPRDSAESGVAASPQVLKSSGKSVDAARTRRPAATVGADATDHAAPETGSADSGTDSNPAEMGEPTRELERGLASWYGPGFQGRRTASGERFDMHGMTAAHKTLAFGTRVRVRSLVTGKEVEVRVNDRGPYARGRVIDLSRAAAKALGLLELGVKNVLLLVPASTAPGSDAALAARKRPGPLAAATPVAGQADLSIR